MDVTLSELREEVARVFERSGPPSWPAPRPSGTDARPEEYSRVTEPSRYQVVHLRARAWAEVLAQRLGATVEALAPAGERPAFDRGVRVVPRQPGALPLVLLERDHRGSPDDDPLAVLEVAVARPDVVVETQPDCGCDACDFGSRDLLEAVDNPISQIVEGPYVVLRGPTWHSAWHPEGGGASGEGRMPDFGKLTGLSRRLAAGERARLPRGSEAFVGRSWLG